MAGRPIDPPPFRTIRQDVLAGGVNNTSAATSLTLDETPDALNVDFDNESVQTTGGAIKFNNQVAPGSAIRTRVDPALSPLMVLPLPLGGSGNGALGQVDVPLRGYGYMPYSVDYDLGGRFTSEGTFGVNEVFHIRQGRSFELDVSFEIPPEEKLYESPTPGLNAPATITTFNPANGFDEALDECFCIIQKGGDRTAPMSWALAVVNVGNAVGLGGAGATWPHLPIRRPSNYCLAFIWYDAPGWGECSISSMKYNLTTGQAVVGGAASQFSTQAYRAILIHKYVEPGRRYSVALQLKMDTGSAGTTTPVAANTAWNGDGFFKVWVSEEAGAAESFTYTDLAATTSGLDVCRGPSDSLSYLCRYGIRYAGRDAMFAGLGMRFAPWMRCGFIPFGADDTPLRSGGFQMVDRTTVGTADLYGAATYSLLALHVSGNSYMTLNQLGVSTGDVNFGADPKGRQTATGPTTFFEWDGLKNSPNCNANALRGYRLIATVATDVWTPPMLGMVMTFLDYSEVAGAARMNFLDGADAARFNNFGPARGLIQCFRWHQRELIIGQVRIFGTPRAYDDADALKASRRQLSLHSSLRLDDPTEPDIENLIAYWRMDDSEGAVLKETVAGGYRNGFLCPFGNAATDGGGRGKGMSFLSGEGEALTRDLSDDPVFQRELQRMLSGSSQGFGFELTMVPTEAFYAIGVQEGLPDSGGLNGKRPSMVPDLVCWDIKDATKVGTRSIPRPLLVLSHRTLLASVDPNPFRAAAGFGVAVAVKSDQEDIDEITPQDLMPWYRDAVGADTHNRFDRTAPWVGRLVTIQVGIQRTAVADQYDVYMAMTPKDAFLPENGDPSGAEFAYWTDGAVGASGDPYEQNTYYTAAHLTISRKDLARSVITVGGRWNCKGKPGDTNNLGYGELNARMLVDEVRWFATSAAGALPAASGGVVTNRNGKLEGTNCLPPRALDADEILQPLGEGVRAVNVIQGSVTVSPPSATGLFTGDPWSSQRAVKGLYLFVSGDVVDVPQPQTFGLTKTEFYGIAAVAANGVSMSTRSPYIDPSRNGAVAGVTRLMGYCTFDDDVRDRPLLLGRGKTYAAQGITVSDVILTDTLWTDTSPIGGGWMLRIYSPLGRSSSSEILPQWTRGLVTERRGPDDGILGMYGFNQKVYAAVRGAVHEADDRWRPVEFTDDVRFGIEFRAQKLQTDISIPLAQDRIEGAAIEAFLPQFTAGAYVVVMDARGVVDRFDEYQTIIWLGDPLSDPSLLAGSASSAHRFQYALRLNQGKPELVIGSSAFYTGTTRPEKGLFVATAQQAVTIGEPFHIRFYLWTQGAGTILCKPFCKINGKNVAVRVNAVDNNAAIVNADQWMMVSAMVTNTGGGGTFPKGNARVLIGCGRDSYRAPNSDLAFVASTVQGTMKAPQRIQGYLHSFDGTLADLVIARVAPWSGILASGAGTPAPPDFDPLHISYAGAGNYTQLQVLGKTLGVGHKVFDSGSATQFIIKSHPFVSVYHELGGSTRNASWAENGSQLYVTNGGLPAVIIDGVGMAAGVLTPTIAPSFSVVRFPLWKANVRGTGTDDSYDPIQQAAVGATKQVYHYNSVGNSYMRFALDAGNLSLMAWIKDGYFYAKGYVRPRSVAGRIQLLRKADGSQSGGPFLDIVDGKVRFGWYDLDLKTEVYVESSGPVFQPNDVHYVNVRKRWPIDDALEVNWQNSYFTDGRVRRLTVNVTAGIVVGQIIASGAKRGLVTKFTPGGITIEYVALVGAFAAADVLTAGPTVVTNPVRPMNDVLQVRRFKRNGEAAFATQAVPGAFRNLVSLTTAALALPAGTSATGLVSAPGAIYSGAAAGVVNTSATAPAMGNLFSSDMVGMYWEWGTGATDAAGSVAGKKYRITAINSATQLVVVNEETGAVPNFASTTDKPGGVFTGIELVRSTSFLSSKSPDTTQNVIEMMGSSIQGESTSGYAAFTGELYSFGFGITNPAASGTNGQCFEAIDTSIAGLAASDPISTGTDAFAAQNYDGAGGEPGALRYDALLQVYCTDGRTYVAVFGGNSSQPTTTLIVESDPHTPSVTPTCTGTSSIDPFFAYIQEPDQWSVQRQIAVAFFDKTQQIVGNPSPQVTIKADAEDAINPSGAVRIRVTNLPVARAESELWIFESVGDGSSGALFRVAVVENGTAEAAVQFTDEETSLSGVVLEFTNAQPPRCNIVEASGIRMVYGALEEQPDACVASKPAFPGQVDFSKLFRLNSGFGTEVLMLKDLDGYLVASKRRQLTGITFDLENNALVTSVTAGAGCVAHLTAQALDGLIAFLSDKGLYLVARGGVTNLGQPKWISENVRRFFSLFTDPRRYSRAVACLNQRRQQYVLALKLLGQRHQFARVAFDLSDQGKPRFALYQNPNITALTSLSTREGGIERLIGGTEEGFAVWLDDPRTNLCMLGPDPAQWGYNQFDAGSVVTTTGMSISPGGFIDSDLEGLRGTLLRWTDANDVDRQTLVLGNDASYVHFQDVEASAPAASQGFSVGSPGYLWDSGWRDMDNREIQKQLKDITFDFSPGAVGDLVATVYTDLDAVTVRKQITLDLDAGQQFFECGDVEGTRFKVVLTSPQVGDDVSFELASVVWRVRDTDQQS